MEYDTWVSCKLSSRTLAFLWASMSCMVGEIWGGLRVMNRSTTVSTPGCPNENTFLPGENTMIATSTPQSVQSSLAFLKSPDRRFEKVTCRLLSLGIFTIATFWRPLLFLAMLTQANREKQWKKKETASICASLWWERNGYMRVEIYMISMLRFILRIRKSPYLLPVCWIYLFTSFGGSRILILMV